MWGTFTAETPTPFIECDFISMDGFEMLEKTKAEVEAMSKGDLLEMRTRQVWGVDDGGEGGGAHLAGGVDDGGEGDHV